MEQRRGKMSDGDARADAVLQTGISFVAMIDQIASNEIDP